MSLGPSPEPPRLIPSKISPGPIQLQLVQSFRDFEFLIHNAPTNWIFLPLPSFLLFSLFTLFLALSFLFGMNNDWRNESLNLELFLFLCVLFLYPNLGKLSYLDTNPFSPLICFNYLLIHIYSFPLVYCLMIFFHYFLIHCRFSSFVLPFLIGPNISTRVPTWLCFHFNQII